MEYTTTKCPHCGYRTRNRESGVPKITLGQTLVCCPMCGKLIVDPIYTEYEFMSEKEQKKYSTSHITTIDTIGGVLLLILGVFFFIIGAVVGNTSSILFALFVGGGCIWMGIRRFLSVQKSRELNIGEQAIYESLLRTSNNKYVELLKSAYGEERTYQPIPNRSEVINDYKKYSTENVHRNFRDPFLKLLDVIGNDNNNNNNKEVEIKKAKSSSSFVDGGALVAGIMALPSVIIGEKQNKELKKKNNTEKKLAEEKTDTVEQTVTLDKKLFKNAEKSTRKKVESTNNQQSKTNKVKSKENVNKNKFLELKELFDEGLITEEEYNEKRKKFLEEL